MKLAEDIDIIGNTVIIVKSSDFRIVSVQNFQIIITA